MPNVYIDLLFPLLGRDEQALLTYAVRRIFGWNKRSERISVSDFAAGTGMGRSGALHGLAVLVKFGLLVVVAENDGSNQGRMYGLETFEKNIDLSGLNKRRRMAFEDGQVRTAKATETRKERSVPRTESGTSYVPLSRGKPHSPNTKNTSLQLEVLNPIKPNTKNKEIPYSLAAGPRVHGNPQFSEDQPSLYPTSKTQMFFFARLAANYRAKKLKPPERFPTFEMKAKFEAEEERLGRAKTESAIGAGLEKGITSVKGLVDFVAGCDKPGKQKAAMPGRMGAIIKSMKGGAPEFPAPND